MSELVSCPMCSYFASREQPLRHVCRIHEHDPNFLIYYSTCSRSFTKLDSFRKHKLRSSECSSKGDQPSLTPQSRIVLDPTDDMSPTSNYDGGESSSIVLAPRRPSSKWRAATFILEIKEKHLSQAAVDTATIVDDVTSERPPARCFEWVARRTT